ncbi:MAG: DEAD/DEAH box helicase, partial [Bacteroidales bacterium]|nr:DEAD/DEAH box helicase [Bacteroidales bacterium]
ETAVEKLQKLIYPFILRRTKQQVLSDLPEKIEQTIFCEMTDVQAEIYEREKSKVRNQLFDLMDKGLLSNSTMDVIQGLVKLRQIACSPALVDNAYQDGSGKTDEIMMMLQNVVDQGHKVLVFSSFVKHLDLIANELQSRGLDYAMLTGQTEERENEVEKFLSNDDVPVFLISIKAGGTGLNLTQADYVFIIDPWWNPAVEEQAIARAHRIGQKNSVMVYRFISAGTVEEKIQVRQQKKAGLAAAFVNETTLFNPALKEDVMEILG